LLGGYFSNRFFQAAIAKDFYVKKVEEQIGRPNNKKRSLSSKKTFKEEPVNILGSHKDNERG